MSWLKVALGLISTAVGTEAGREVISDVRSAIRKDPPAGEAAPQGLNMETVQSLIAKHREEVDRNWNALFRCSITGIRSWRKSFGVSGFGTSGSQRQS